MYKDVKIGTFKGTGAKINIACGFVPSYVKIMNIQDGGGLYATGEWFASMGEGYAWKTKAIVDSGSTGNKSSDLVTNGIYTFAGRAAGARLTGTVSVTAGSATLTGSSTEFLTELDVGDTVRLSDGQEFTITAIASGTSATLNKAASSSLSGSIAVVVNGKPAGFSVGTDADFNTANETVCYMAIRG